jgi:signal peptidase II
MKKTIITVVIAVVFLVGLDQASKLLILNHNGGRELREVCHDILYDQTATFSDYPGIDCSINDIPVIDGVFHFTFSFNTGASFGSFEGQIWLFFVISAMAAVLFYFLVKELDLKGKKLYSIAVILMISGAIGNFIDRLLYHKVTDFIELDFMRFAIFNVADSFLVVGVILFGLDIILEEFYGKNNRKQDESTTG